MDISKMIKLPFIVAGKEIIIFSIEGKNIIYMDKIWPNGLQIYPYNPTTVNALRNSRSQNMQKYGQLITESNEGVALEEYERCKTEEELAEVIKKDCKLKGLIEVKK